MLKVLVIGPGSGTSSSPNRLSTLHASFDVSCPTIPEPQQELDSGTALLIAEIERFRPEVLVAGSRGSLYLSRLLALKAWSGACLVWGCMYLSECVAAVRAANDREYVVPFEVPLLLFHGTLDELVPFEDVKNACKAFPACKLLEAPGEKHALHVLDNDPVRLVSLVREAYAWSAEPRLTDYDTKLRFHFETKLLQVYHLRKVIVPESGGPQEELSSSWSQ